MKNANVKAIIEANYACKQFLDYLIDKYELQGEERENAENMQNHLINLSVIFGKIKK
jgi:hypothetical protein